MEITRATHPSLFEALEIITSGGQPSYDIPAPWDAVVPEIEAALAKLSPTELEVFAIGEENDMMAVIGEAYDLTTAHIFLNEFFEGLDAN